MNTQQLTKFTMLEKVALYFSKKIDSNLAIYNATKDLNIYVRYLFYIFISVAAPVSLYFLSSFILNLNTFELDNNLIDLIQSLFNVVCIFIFLLTSFVFSYEFLINKNINFQKLKEEEKEIEKLKKIRKDEFWRLRNLNLFFRVLIYVSVVFITLPLFYISPILNAMIIIAIVMFEAKKFNFI